MKKQTTNFAPFVFIFGPLVGLIIGSIIGDIKVGIAIGPFLGLMLGLLFSKIKPKDEHSEDTITKDSEE